MDKLKNAGTYLGLAIALIGGLRMASITPEAWHPALDLASMLLGIATSWFVKAGLLPPADKS